MTKSERFRGLHVIGNPLILVNVWDVGSAKAVDKAGAAAIGTSSWSIAAANGFDDGERMPRAVALAALERIAGATDLPVTADLERGYGLTNSDVREAAALATDAGAVGCNIEDGAGGGDALRERSDQCERIAAIRDGAGGGFFINARVDVFFQSGDLRRPQDLLAETVDRARAYGEAGADGIFVPGLDDLVLIGQLARALPLPLNVMVTNVSTDLHALAACGVARISFGATPYQTAMTALGLTARAAFNPTHQRKDF